MRDGGRPPALPTSITKAILHTLILPVISPHKEKGRSVERPSRFQGSVANCFGSPGMSDFAKAWLRAFFQGEEVQFPDLRGLDFFSEIKDPTSLSEMGSYVSAIILLEKG
jgi:hypothetical protein